jgi:TolB-like protein
MVRKFNVIGKFWHELKRRKVTHVITGYAATAFVILQLVDIVAQPLHLPAWTLTSLIIILSLGFFIVLIVSWNYDFTESGVKKTKPEGDIEQEEQITISTFSGWKIATYISLFIIVALIAFNFVTKKRLSEDIRTSEKSIAVLPFKLLSDEPDKQYLADGMMDAILLHLSKIKDLRVLSRTSVEQYRETDKTIPTIGRELDVEYILEGSFQKSGDNARLIVQLVKTKKENHLWSNEYNRKWSDVFSVQSEVAQSVARELKSAITPDVKQLINKRPTNNMAAYDAYMMGLFYYWKLSKDDMETAMQYFELAKERDPGFALAYVGIGRVWRGLQQLGIVRVSEGAPQAETAVKKALELDSTYSEVHHLLGGIKTWTMWDWEGGEASYRKALELNPKNADTHSSFSHLLNVLGRSDEAMKHIAIALDLDPINSKIQTFYGVDLLFVRRYNDAVEAFKKALNLNPSQVAVDYIIPSLFFAGREGEAIEMLKKFWNDQEFLNAIDDGYNEGGFQGAMKKLADVRAERSKTMYIAPYGIAHQYALAGDINNAIHWLEKSYEEHDPNLPYLLLPTFDKLRDDPRFQEIARRMNLPYK